MELRYSPDYFFDQMSMYELGIILENYDYRFRNDYEIARFLGYIQVQANSTKKISIQDIMKFQWDVKMKPEEKKVNKKELAKLRERADKIANQLNKKQDAG